MKIWINKKTIGGILLGAVLVLLFFSKTIYTYYLPEVTAVKPGNGTLSKVEVGYGTVRWAEADTIYIPEAGTIGAIYVGEGEYIEAGGPLFAMEYDMDENEWNLLETENSIKKLQAEQQDLENKIQLANQPDAETLNVRQSLAQAEHYLNAAAALYEIGSLSARDFNEARNEVNYLRLKLENLNVQAAENMQSLQLQMEQTRLEIENLAISEARYKKIQAIHHDEIVITALQSGMVISVEIAKGEKVLKDSPAITVGAGDEYDLECSVALENNFITVGDNCKLSNSSHQIQGVITSVKPDAAEKIVTIRFSAEGVTAGETLEILFQKQSATNYILVPNAAVCQDSDGYYLKQIKRRDGIMGKEYYLARVDVYIGDADDQNTVIVQGVTFFEPVLLYSNKTAVTGDVVLLKNAGDFFEE